MWNGAAVGKHLILEMYGMDFDKIAKVENVSPFVEKMIDDSNLQKEYSSFKQFCPYGVTGVILISESHFSIHTWPEYEYAAIDLFSCGSNEDVYNIAAELINYFNPQVYYEYYIDRGKKGGIGELLWD